MRNPWGSETYKGPYGFSDDVAWSRIGTELEHERTQSDGEWWTDA
jgi:hypothetical protein